LIKKALNKSLLVKAILILILLTYTIPNFSSIDRIGNQYLYLSIINTISIVCLYFFKINGLPEIFKKSLTIKTYCLFMISSLISIFYANNLPEALITLNQYFNIFTSFLIFLIVIQKIDGKTDYILKLFLAAFIVEMLFSYIPIINDLENGGIRARSMDYIGLSANINITSFSIVFKLPIVFYFLNKTNNTLKRIVLFLLLVATFFLIFILGTRGALLGMIICLSIYIFDLFKNNLGLKNKIKSGSIIFFALIVSTVFNLIVLKDSSSKNVLSRAATISLSTQDGSINQRLRYYKQGITQFINNPFVPIGLGNWKLNSIGYDKNNINGYTIPYHAHNDFIQILVEQGLLGMFFYIMIYLSILVFIIKHKILNSYDTRYVAFLTMILVFLLDSMINFPLSRPINQIQIMLVLSAVIINKTDNEK
tara:strand:- start:2833 stop:4101 length:1269 start_codon:yes stop_codon:yes gene_type:complete